MPVGLLVAHQGGWDEALFVALPLLLFFVILQVAKRRAERELRQNDPPE